jgi:HSP20 family molecular chaperone IbpA
MAEMDKLLPNVKVTEDKKSYQLKITLSFLKEEEIDVRVKNGKLYISGMSESEKNKKDEQGAIQQIFSASSFNHCMNLPVDADERKIEAEFKEQQLTITIQKQADFEQNNARIPVNAKKSQHQQTK